MAGVRTKAKTAREMFDGDMTQAKAAELLYMSEGNLRRIENGQQACSSEIAQAMAKVYNAPWVADETVPDDYMPVPRAQAVLKYYSERRDVERMLPVVEKILADGIVDKDEEPDFTRFMQEVKEERIAGRDLMYAR